MTMTPRLRKFVLTAHITFSIGWFGAVAAFITIAIAGLMSQDAQMVHAADLTMELIGWSVLVPSSLGALVTGVIQSLGTKWGLFRHYWVLVKLLLTIAATLVLLFKMPSMSYLAGVAAKTIPPPSADLEGLRIELLGHAGGGLLVLLAAIVLAVYKPWGRTRYGRRRQHEVVDGGAAVDAAPTRHQPIESA
ncbi:MAG: DUF2269 domain-containing protein [Pseudonocardiaceae bacterium]